MHTDSSLRIFDKITIQIGAELHAFADKTCAAFDTSELQHEAKAHKGHQLKKARESSLALKGIISTTCSMVDHTHNELTHAQELSVSKSIGPSIPSTATNTPLQKDKELSESKAIEFINCSIADHTGNELTHAPVQSVSKGIESSTLSTAAN